MFHLRGEVKEVRESKIRADEEIKSLKSLVETLRDSLHNTQTSKFVCVCVCVCECVFVCVYMCCVCVCVCVYV